MEANISQARGAGQPLHGRLRASMEDAFQADFSLVRVHSNRQSDHLNRSLSAQAFTTGQDVFFKNGEHHPHSTCGKSQMAHELTHVIQQNLAAVRRKPNREARRAYAAPVRARTTDERPQRAVIDYASQEREKCPQRNTAAQIALAPFGGEYGAGKGAYKGYQGIYEGLRGDKGENASLGRKVAAGFGSLFLGSMALPFTMGWGALRGAVSGLANPHISGAKALPGPVHGIPGAIRQGLGNYRELRRDQRGRVEASSPLSETEDETRSQLAGLAAGARRSLHPVSSRIKPPGSAPTARRGLIARRERHCQQRPEHWRRIDDGVGAAAARGCCLTGWTSGAADIN